jgi:hypothetical protein
MADIAEPTTSPVPVDQVEHARRRSRHRASTCANSSAVNGDSSLGLSTTVQPAASAGRDLGGDLVQRPVPRRDQRADADRLLADVNAVHLASRTRNRAARRSPRDMLDAEVALPGAGERDRRAHLGDDRLRERPPSAPRAGP